MNPINKTHLFDEISATLKEISNHIELHESKGLGNDEYMKLFNKISNFADKGPKKNGENLHEKELFDFFKKEILQFLQGIQKKLETKTGNSYLEEFVNYSSNYSFFAGWLMRLFSYLNQFYLKKKNTDLAMVIFETFKANFLGNIHYELFTEVFTLLDKERDGFNSNKTLILKVVQFYFLMCYDKNIRLDYDKELKYFSFSGINEKEDYQFYKENFEAKLLENIKSFYLNKVTTKWLCESSSDFQIQALEAFKKEKEMAINYYPISQEKILELLKKVIVEDHYQTVLDNPKSGLKQMLLNNSFSDLTNCYNLYINVKYILKEKVSHIFKEFLELKASKITTVPVFNIRSMPEIMQCFESFIQLKKEIEIKVDHFQNFLEIQKSVDDCFYNFFRTDESARLLAIFFDLVLRKLHRTKNEQDTELPYLVKLFKYVSSRDEFFEMYKKKLISRILDESIKSFDHEKDYLSNLKKECGILSTIINCESLLQDTEIISKNLTSDFKKHLINNKEIVINYDFDLKIIEKSCYNSSKKYQNFEYVNEILPLTSAFQKFYSEINQNRIIEFIYQDGISELYFNTNKKYRLIIFNDSLPLFMLFNTQKFLEKNEILIKTGLSEKLLYERLKVFEKSQIILKETDKDRYYVNTSFKSDKPIHELHRVKIQAVKENPQENLSESQKTISELDEVKIKRQNILDASLVRIMKSRITMSYNDLMSDCTKLVQNIFKPDIKMIRNRIESLMERGYMGRDENDAKILKYIS